MLIRYFTILMVDTNQDINSFKGFIFHPFTASENTHKLFLSDKEQLKTSSFDDVLDFIKSKKENSFHVNHLTRFTATKQEH